MTTPALKPVCQNRLPHQVTTLLAELGLEFRTHRLKAAPRRHLPRTSFWLKFESRLHVILVDAHRAYRKLAKRLHPDKPTGCASKFAYINAVWQRVKRIFRNKGIEL